MVKVDEDAIRSAKSKSLIDLVSREIKLTRAGPEWMGLCPFHKEKTPSFSVNEHKGLYKCFGCGAAGDVIDFTQHAYRLSFPDAVKMLADDDSFGPIKYIPRAQPENDGGKTAFALKIWRSTQPLAGSLAEGYLRSRAITIPVPETLRFHPALEHRTGLRFPTLVGAVTCSPSRKIIAIHRTFLKDDGSAKIELTRPRMMLGPCKGGAVRLAAWSAGPLAVAEGIETALSVMQMTGIATWAALSDGGIENLVLPDNAKDIVICADHDANGVGQTAARRAADKWRDAGRDVRIALPKDQGTDFNDLLKAGRGFSL
jgi:hypothetical protein